MKQSRAASFIEAITSTAAGLGLSLILQATVLAWMLGTSIPLAVNIGFAVVMTIASICRQFILRRLFEALHIRRPLSPAMAAIIAERIRQIETEGWSTEHDDLHEIGELAQAGVCYAEYAASYDDEGRPGKYAGSLARLTWPWLPAWWKPRDFRRDLVRAGALILAEIEKFDRRRKPKLQPKIRGGYQPGGDGPRGEPPHGGTSGVMPAARACGTHRS